MARWCIVFPGQGSQYPGMSKVLIDTFPWTRSIYEEASEAIKENLLKLCHEGPADSLQLTKNAQPSILVTSYAWYQVFKRELDIKPAAGAGHSLGEYTALLAAGAMTLPEAVRLVRLRGELMQSVVPPGKGKMAAVLGLDEIKIRLLCEKASKGNDSIVVPANFNAPGQVVIAGHADAVDRAAQIGATDPEVKARKVIPLNVSAPFHCPLMKPVAEQFKGALSSVKWNPLQFPIAFNVDGVLRKEAKIAEMLTEQIDHPVLWTACAANLVTPDSESVFVEPGPGKVLTGLVKRIVTDAKIFCSDSIEDFRAFEKAYKEMMS